MGKRVRENTFLKFESVILTIILILWIIIISLNRLTYHNNKKGIIPLEKKLQDTELNIKEKNNKLDEINNNIKKYNNIENSINNTKKEYFNNIKKLEDDIIAGKSDKKIAYITFDDGPYYNTYRVLDILDEYNVKATFFTISMNGEYCYDNKDENCFALYKEYVLRGHTIANHTYTHAIFKGLYSSTDSFLDAIDRQDAHIKEYALGYSPNIVRFPGGSSTAKGLKEPIIEGLRERGYGWVDWSANDGDGGGLSSSEQAWNNFINTINDKIEVILFHDYNYYTTEILPDVITYLQDNGYEIYPLFYESSKINK